MHDFLVHVFEYRFQGLVQDISSETVSCVSRKVSFPTLGSARKSLFPGAFRGFVGKRPSDNEWF